MSIIHSAHDDRPTSDILSDLRLGRDMIVREGHHKLNKWLAIEQYMFDAERRLEILEAELAEVRESDGFVRYHPDGETEFVPGRAVRVTDRERGT